MDFEYSVGEIFGMVVGNLIGGVDVVNVFVEIEILFGD